MTRGQPINNSPPGSERRSVAFLAALNAIAQAAGSGSEIATVLTEALDRLGELGLTDVSFHIWDPTGHRLHQMAQRGPIAARLGPWADQPDRPAELEPVLASGQTVNLLRLENMAESAIGESVRLILAPIRAHELVMGLLMAAAPGLEDDQELTAFISAIGIQLGLALENIGLLSEVTAVGREWAATFDALKDLIVLCDLNGRIIRVNRSLARAAGLSVDQLEGLSCHQLFEGRLCGCHADACRIDGRDHQDLKTFEVELKIYNRERRHLVTINHLDEQTLVVVARDVTVLADLDKVRAEAERLGELDRLKTAFIGAMSHEFRTPLHHIITSSEMLLDGLYDPLSDDQAEAVTDVARAGHRLLNMVNEIVDLTRLETGHLSLTKVSVSLSDPLKSALTGLRNRAEERGVELHPVPAKIAARVEGDPRRLRQIMAGLISRAIDRTASGGRVDISLEAGDHAVRLTVEDPSPPDEAETAFTLSLAQRLAQLHGGRIILQDGGHAGSQAVLELPMKVEDVASTDS